jgi:hypothetical protein
MYAVVCDGVTAVVGLNCLQQVVDHAGCRALVFYCYAAESRRNSELPGGR